MRSSEPALASVLAALIVASCGPPGEGSGDGGPGDRVEVACDLGTTVPEGTFQPLEDAERVELVLGFQGFLFVVVSAQAEWPAGAPVEVSTSLTLEGGEPFGGTQRASMRAAGSEVSVTEDINVFFASSNIAEYRDRDAVVGLRLTGATWYCVTTASVRLVDDDPCIHTGETPVCPDGGT